MTSFIQKFKSGDTVQLLSDKSKKFIVDKYHFQLPIIKTYKFDTVNDKFNNLPNIGHETEYVWCISIDTKKQRKIHQDKLELTTTF